ncbi:MAG: IPTL-CTERM sorting domain-containing protein [Nevskia sp.]|nr:IPTL-CTERM sorting domain-containing protein [Nevskia sp.]
MFTSARSWVHLARLSAVVATFLLCPAGEAGASPITYQVTGTASGSLGGTNFTNAAVTISGTGDTANTSNRGSGVLQNPLQATSVSISGFSTVYAVDHIYFFVNQGTPGAGFIDNESGDVVDLGAGSFSSYNAATSIGPVSASSRSLAPFGTSGGTLNMTSASNLVFNASMNDPASVPAMPPWAVAVFGLLLAWVASRTLRAKAWSISP